MIEGKILKANERLKSAKVGVTIGKKGDRLYLRATFPPKPDSLREDPYQQRLFPGYHANPNGLKLAEQEARIIGALLDAGQFDWSKYLTPKLAKPLTVGNWIARYERDYFTRRKRTPETLTTWRQDYQKAFSVLPVDAVLTVDLLRKAIEATEPDTRTRRRFVDVLSRLATFAGLDMNFKPLRGSYSTKSAAPRKLPSDEMIAEWREKIPNLQWRRAYSLIAVYGIRGHEVIKSTLEFPKLRVHSNTKTGSRIVYPYYPEWAKDWDLEGDLPDISGADNSAIGNRVTHAFKRYKIPFTPLDLRHAWAVRTIRFRVPDSEAARQMGHSVTVHCTVYQKWITERDMDALNQSVLSRSDRPLPP